MDIGSEMGYYPYLGFDIFIAIGRLVIFAAKKAVYRFFML